MLVARALATVTLRSPADANLVDEAGSSAGGDEVFTAALVAVEDILGVKLVEPEPSEMVGGNRFRL